MIAHSSHDAAEHESARAALARAVERRARGRGVPTTVPRQFLVRQDEELVDVDATYRPVLCFVAQGTKTVRSGAHEVRVSGGEMFIGLLRLPARVSFATPYRSAMLDVDPSILASALTRVPAPRSPSPSSQAFFTATMPLDLLAAVTRWVGLAADPAQAHAIGPIVEEEILVRALLSPLGAALRTSTDGGVLAHVRAVAAQITDDPGAEVRADDLAARAGVSVATFYRRFRELTGLSPVQFQKLARLQRARQLLAEGNATAASAAIAVGYVSVQQFSRDYRRQHGLPPGRDAAAMRTRSSAWRSPDPD